MCPILLFGLALMPIATVFLLLVVLERLAKFSMLVAYIVTALTALLIWGPDLAKVLGASVNGLIGTALIAGGLNGRWLAAVAWAALVLAVMAFNRGRRAAGAAVAARS